MTSRTATASKTPLVIKLTSFRLRRLRIACGSGEAELSVDGGVEEGAIAWTANPCGKLGPGDKLGMAPEDFPGATGAIGAVSSPCSSGKTSAALRQSSHPARHTSELAPTRPSRTQFRMISPDAGPNWPPVAGRTYHTADGASAIGSVVGAGLALIGDDAEDDDVGAIAAGASDRTVVARAPFGL